ncbi:MAG: hypothetical protein U1F43_31100 [Myxococcota bacterium]
MRRVHAVSALLALALVASSTGCATIGRERCSGDGPGEASSERDQVLVKRLLRSLFSDDFAAFQRLQPTESQYVTLAWRFGHEEADRMMSVIREPTQAATVFQATRTRMMAAGVDVRTAARCTRRIDTRADEPRFYTLDLAFGEGAATQHITADVFDSGGRVSLVGSLGKPGAGAKMDHMLDLMEGFITILEGKAERLAKLTALRAYSAAHKQELHDIQHEIQALMSDDPTSLMSTFGRLADRTSDLSTRTTAAMEQTLSDDELRDVVFDFFGTTPTQDEPPPDEPKPDAPTPDEPKPDVHAPNHGF